MINASRAPQGSEGESPIIAEVEDILTDPNPDIDVVCDMIEKLCGDSSAAPSPFKGRFLELRGAGVPSYLLSLQEIVDEYVAAHSDNPDIEFYRECAHIAGETYREALEVTKSTPKSTTADIGNDLNRQADLFHSTRGRLQHVLETSA